MSSRRFSWIAASASESREEVASRIRIQRVLQAHLHNRHTLPLPAGKAHAPISHEGVIARAGLATLEIGNEFVVM